MLCVCVCAGLACPREHGQSSFSFIAWNVNKLIKSLLKREHNWSEWEITEWLKWSRNSISWVHWTVRHILIWFVYSEYDRARIILTIKKKTETYSKVFINTFWFIELIIAYNTFRSIEHFKIQLTSYANTKVQMRNDWNGNVDSSFSWLSPSTFQHILKLMW